MSKSWRADADRVAAKRTKANHRQMRAQRDNWRNRDAIVGDSDASMEQMINSQLARRLDVRGG